jgi:ABC-2 type transport system ATP-binding protein
MSIADLVISVAGLSKQFAGRTVLKGLSFHVVSGEILGLVGANGGGKTTTLRLLAGLLRPDVGDGTFLGRPLFHPSSRRHLGYVTQRNALYPDLTVSENLAFRAAVHRIDRARVDEAVNAYGIGDVLAQRVSALSGGWGRRVEFVASVLHRPKLLLLDEPTAGLDVVTRRDMWQWMAALAGQGCAIIVSTHDLIEAEQCSNILLYHNGDVRGPMTPAAARAERGSATLEDAVFAMAAR